MNIVVNPLYTHLYDFVNQLPHMDCPPGEIIKDNRNVITKFTIGNDTLVIKKFIKPNPLNQVMYAYFRKSKARRSYEYSLRLKELGLGTAEPVAYIDIKKNGLFHTGYYISYFLTGKIFTSIDFIDDAETKNKLLEDFAAFTAEMHTKGAMHYDYNPSNMFYSEEGNHYRFSVIDINRMRFRKGTKARSIKALTTLLLDLPVLMFVLERYAKLRGWNLDIFLGRLFLKRGLKISLRIKWFFKDIIRFFFKRGKK